MVKKSIARILFLCGLHYFSFADYRMDFGYNSTNIVLDYKGAVYEAESMIQYAKKYKCADNNKCSNILQVYSDLSNYSKYKPIKIVTILNTFYRSKDVVNWIDYQLKDKPFQPGHKRFYPDDLFYAALIDLKFKNVDNPSEVITCPNVILAFGAHARNPDQTNSYLYSNIYNQAAVRTLSINFKYYTTTISCDVPNVGNNLWFDAKVAGPTNKPEYNLIIISPH